MLAPFPVILGHEGAGVIESIGDNVSGLQVGDKVVPCALPHCGECHMCQHPTGHGCTTFPTNPILQAGPQTVTAKGKRLYPLMAMGTFCEYIVVPSKQVAKVDPSTQLDKLAPLGCAVTTGWGAAEAVANVKQGDDVAVWGMGPVGISTIMACSHFKARNVIAIDVVEEKLELARKFGATHTMLADKTVPGQIMKICGKGLDYAFECSGNGIAEGQTIESLQSGYGISVMVGCPPPTVKLDTNALMFILQGKTIKGALMGGWKNSLEAIPRLAESYTKQRSPNIEGLVTSEIGLEGLNDAIFSMANNTCTDLRVLVKF